jgi:hypothetical protein
VPGYVREAGNVRQVVLLSLADGCLGAPVLACRDALIAEGAEVSTAVPASDAELDEIIARLDDPAGPAATTPRLVVAAAAVGQVRAVVRRMVRRYAPPPGRRPPDLAPDRTLPDLPPIGVLPLYGARLFDLPADPAEVAKAVLHGTPARLDLLRTDAGSVTLDGALIGGAAPWSARIEVDDVVLAQPAERIAACAIGNGLRYAMPDGLPLLPRADPADGVLDVAVAVPVRIRRWGRTRTEVEVRRVRGRAVSVQPVDEAPFLDDEVAGTLSRKRSWWMERGAWAVLRH